VRQQGRLQVLVVDDSPLLARLLTAELNRHGGVHARVGSSGLPRLRDELVRYHPDVIVLDLALRACDTLDLLHKLRLYYPVPVIVSARNIGEDAVRAVQAVQLGALDVVRRPEVIREPELRALAQELVVKIRVAASAARPVPHFVGAAEPPISFEAAGINPDRHVIAVGASTGGTRALEVMLGRMPADTPPIVMVQHMPAGFTHSFAARLNSASAVHVSEAVDGERLDVGRAVLARGDTHLVVRRAGRQWCVRYTNQEPVNRHCPSVDVLFDSVAAKVGPSAIGVLLTGMGNDGAQGLLRVREAGGITIAQSKATCVVYGMPKVAVDLGAAMATAAPEDVPRLATRLLHKAAISSMASSNQPE